MTAGITPTAYADDYVCEVTIGSNTTYYTDFGDALGYIQILYDTDNYDPTTITLLSNVEYSDQLYLNGPVTIFDLNGYTLNVDASIEPAIYLHYSSITLDDPSKGAFTVTGTRGGVSLVGSTLEVSSITTATDDINSYGALLGTGSNLTVHGDVTAGMGYGLELSNNSNATIDGVITADNYMLLNYAPYDQSSGVDDSALPGYLHYTDGMNNVWVKIPVTDQPIDLSTATVTIPAKAWTGKQIKPTAFTYDGVSYPISTNTSSATYGTNKNIGKGTVKITGQGMFAGTKTITFQIVPKTNKITKITAAKKSMKVTWTKVSSTQKVTGYQVHYRVKGKTTWKTKTFTSKYSSATIKSLLKGKKYQVQVRSYKTVSGTKYYSAWSAVKTSAAIK